VRVVDDVKVNGLDLRLIGVDRSKRVDDPGFPDGLLVDRVAELVPTIILLDADGHELGRVVETAEQPLEQLLVDLLTPVEGW